MKQFTPKGMKTLKTIHLLLIMMWTIGVVMMAILYWQPSSNSLQFLYNQQTAMLIDYSLVIPGAICTVITGILYGLKTNWGFFKYRWLTVKWIVGISVILIGTFGLHPIATEIIANLSPIASTDTHLPTDLFGAKLTVIKIMALVQGLVLIWLVYVSVFKPWKSTKK